MQWMGSSSSAFDKVNSIGGARAAFGREVDSAFQRHGVRVEAMGQKLDPHLHQAMMAVPSDEEPGTIVQEMQAGYTIKDRLLRPALVGVAKKG
jgi:molecular chaperone GrpE